jgi:ParB-like chromosome segregation protein Spo0J
MESATASAVDIGLEFDEDADAVRDTRIEHLLEAWNLPFELEQQFPLMRLKMEDAVQIREQPHRAPKVTVEQYVTHMKHGAIFPPIVVASNGMLVDGNARVDACRLLNRKTFPAYKVKFPQLGMAKMIGAALNQMGGDRLSDDEIIVAAEAMMAESYADEAIARTLGRSISHVRNVRRDRAFREAAERIGLSEIRVPKAMMRVLAGISHDEPLKAALELVTRANPAAKDVAHLVNSIEKTRSDAEALAVIQQTETQWGPVTGPPPTPRPLNRSKAKKALSHVKTLLDLGEQPNDLVMPGNVASAELWTRLNRLATTVVALYAVPKS